MRDAQEWGNTVKAKSATASDHSIDEMLHVTNTKRKTDEMSQEKTCLGFY